MFRILPIRFYLARRLENAFENPLLRLTFIALYSNSKAETIWNILSQLHVEHVYLISNQINLFEIKTILRFWNESENYSEVL